MKKGDVYFRGRLCSVHLKMSFVAAEKKEEREEIRRKMTNEHKMDSRIGLKREEGEGNEGQRNTERERWG